MFSLTCFIILLLSTLTLQDMEAEVDNFIINLINEHQYSECSLFIFQDRFHNDASSNRILASFSGIPGSTSKSAYSVKFNFYNEAGVKNVSMFKGNFNRVDPNEVLPVKFTPNISSFRKRSSNCLVVILFINDISPEFMKQIFKMLTPVFIPITRKDEDFYIFKTKPESHKRLLMMRELPARIKFKIAVGAGESKKGESNKQVVVHTVCFFCGRGGNPRLRRLSIMEDGLPDKMINYFPDFVKDLNGRVLKVTFPLVRANIEADPPYKGINNARRGHWKKMLEIYLNVKFNFTYNMFVSMGLNATAGRGGTGRLLDNGTWVGTTGDLVAGNADIGIVTGYTPKRMMAIDFTNFYDIGYLTFVTGQPTRIYSPLALLWPFHIDMWVAILFSTFISVIFMHGSSKLMKLLHIGSGERWTFSRELEFVISTALDQDSPVLPESQPLRCFVAFWFFFMVILTNIYRSKMVALLAFPVLGKLPTTFEELALPDYNVGFMKHGDAAINTFRASTDPVYVTLVKKMEIISGVGLECLEKVVEIENYACIGYDFSMRHLRERNLSESDTRNLVFAPARTYNVWMGLTLEGKSIYRLNFGMYMSYARAFNLPEVWDRMDMYENVRLLKLKWWKSTGQTDKMKHAEMESEDLTLKHFIGAFYVLGVCLGISGAVFVQEIIAYRKWFKCLTFGLVT